MKNWSLIEKYYIEVPDNIINFLNEITKIYKKYNLSISHEDSQGSFIIEKYDEYNIKWLKNSLINVEGDNVVSKDKIKAKIEEIKEEVKTCFIYGKSGRCTNNCKKACFYYDDIDILQRLLEKEE